MIMEMVIYQIFAMFWISSTGWSVPLDHPGHGLWYGRPQVEEHHPKKVLPQQEFHPVLQRTQENNFIPFQEVNEDGKTNEVITVKEKRMNTKSSLCWIETVRVVDDKKCCDRHISKEYSIVLDSPSKTLPIIPRDKSKDHSTSDAELGKIFDDNPNNMRNFTRIWETDNSIITEHKKIICGFGPIVTKQYFEWPNARRQRVEISLGSEDLNMFGREMPPENREFMFQPTTETSTTYDTVQTPESHTDFVGVPRKAQNLMFRFDDTNTKPLATVIRSPRNNITQKAYLLKRNISYKNLNDSHTLKNPFDGTNLINRLKNIKRPILFNLLFPRDNIFGNLTEISKENNYEVTVNLSVTLEDFDENHTNEAKRTVTLDLTESSLIVISK